MPTSPLSLCVVTGCPNMVTHGRCEQHTLEARRDTDRQRPNGYQRGYTPQWAAFRKAYLEDHPYCESPTCTTAHEWDRTPATDIDHIDGTGRNGPRAYDPTNLQALCHPCHSRLTTQHDGGYGRQRTPRPTHDTPTN